MRLIIEKQLAVAWKTESISYSEIGKRLHISRYAAANLYRYQYTTKPKKRGPKFAINKVGKSSIKRAVCNFKDMDENVNSTKPRKECDLNVSRWTIPRHIKRNGFTYKRMLSNIMLSKKHNEC